MTWREARHIRIFFPPEGRASNPIEQIIGTIIRPLYLNYKEDMHWIWFGRYDDNFAPYAVSHQLPERYNSNGGSSYFDFRLSISQDKRDSFEQDALDLILNSIYFAARWDQYNVLHDLVDWSGNSGNRFIRPDATEDERIERAYLIVNFMDATARLMVDSVVKVDERWHLEPNDNPNNPQSSFFQSIHHLFCNATDVPTFVVIREEVNERTSRVQPALGTDFMFSHRFPHYLDIEKSLNMAFQLKF
jgi:hypothetical protein